jgi:predicted TIM-barrel fold metal-dependent hydrolase
MREKIWTNSGDSHFVEPETLVRDHLPADLAGRWPYSVKDDEWDYIHVDGEVIKRRLPRPIREGEFAGKTIRELSRRPAGAGDARLRLVDLDQEGVWAEVTYPSVSFWSREIQDPNLLRMGARILNDWMLDELLRTSPRFVPTAMVPLIDISDGVAELQRAASLGFRAVFLPTEPPAGRRWNEAYWEPLWSAAEEANIVAAFHIGTDAMLNAEKFRNPGGAVLNFVETTYGGQRAVTQLVASGALDRHPNLRILVSEGGATWAPFLGDRMNEAVRQHSMFVWPKLSMLPKDYIYRQVYCTFQHDETAIQTFVSTGYTNVMWGSDYPHLEGTFGHTQEVLHHLFDGEDPSVLHRITVGAFLELFPEVGEAPAIKAAS